MCDNPERPHFTERFPTLDAVRWADRIQPSLVRHRLEEARGALRSLLRTNWRLMPVRTAFAKHCIEMRINRFAVNRHRRLEANAAALRAAGGAEEDIDTAARRSTEAEYEQWIGQLRNACRR